MPNWTVSDIPPQHGRTAVVTGTGGIGLEVARALAQAGAAVVIAGRDPGKGAAAVARIRRETADADVQFQELDLAALESVWRFGRRLRDARGQLDLLVNNAAVMAPPQRRVTGDGFELQFGTNHLGHFVLTAELLPLLRQSPQARVVTLSSIAARNAAIDFYDLHAERRYRPMEVYGRSKLANLMFALELQRRSDASDWGLRSIAAHPGVARTDLIDNGAGARSLPGLVRRHLWFLFQPAAQGALPPLFAATAPGVRGGRYIGPDGWGGLRGVPTEVEIPPQARDADSAARLWSSSERLTGAAYPTISRATLERPGPSAFA